VVARSARRCSSCRWLRRLHERHGELAELTADAAALRATIVRSRRRVLLLAWSPRSPARRRRRPTLGHHSIREKTRRPPHDAAI
jgi:hypothetical protein